MSKWPTMPLAAVVSSVERPEIPIPGKPYRQVGVRLWGEGAYERELLDGGETKYRTLSRVEADDIVVNKIWARNGSVAVVSNKLAGSYVSGEFPTFRPAAGKLEPRWFHWLTKTPTFWEQCDAKSRGTSGKNRIRPERFLEIEIPLPPLPEQRRIVARIESLAEKIVEAREIRARIPEETQALGRSTRRKIFTENQFPVVSLAEACEEIIDNLHSNPVYADDGVPCIRSPDVGWGTLDLVNARKTSEQEYRRRTVRGEPRIGDIVLVREGGGTGKAALVRYGDRFSLGQRVMMLRPDKTAVLPEFFLHQMLSPTIQEDQIGPLSKGSASPHLNIGALKEFRFQIPSLSEQHRIVDYLNGLQAKVDALKKLQGKTADELAALLPSILDKAFKGEL